MERNDSDRDFAQSSDEELAALALIETALGSVHKPAGDALADRYVKWVMSWAVRWANHLHLRGAARSDLEDVALVALERAIAGFDMERASPGRLHPFRYYLRRKLWTYLSHLLRQQRREEKHYKGSPTPEEVELVAVQDPRRGSRALLSGPESDPAFVAERHDLFVRIWEIVSGLSVEYQFLCREIMEGSSLPAIAKKAGLPYTTIRRRLQKLTVIVLRILNLEED